MNKNRLEAFSDGVLAIIITIMILEIKVPHGADFTDLEQLFPKFISYVLSFIYIGIYWNNHHHLFQITTKINGKVLWANLHLLFWLSLVPVATGWLGENHFAKAPMALYGVILLFAGGAFTILTNTIIANEGKKSMLADALGKDKKGKISILLYAIAIFSSFYNELIAGVLYIFVAIMWLIPETRIEKKINTK